VEEQQFVFLRRYMLKCYQSFFNFKDLLVDSFSLTLDKFNLGNICKPKRRRRNVGNLQWDNLVRGGVSNSLSNVIARVSVIKLSSRKPHNPGDYVRVNLSSKIHIILLS